LVDAQGDWNRLNDVRARSSRARSSQFVRPAKQIPKPSERVQFCTRCASIHAESRKVRFKHHKTAVGNITTDCQLRFFRRIAPFPFAGIHAALNYFVAPPIERYDEDNETAAAEAKGTEHFAGVLEWDLGVALSAPLMAAEPIVDHRMSQGLRRSCLLRSFAPRLSVSSLAAERRAYRVRP
jgi:hypothetical protein